jgi:hypothetical protein
MADFWRGFGEGFGRSYESSFESASKRLEERRKLERAAKAAREKAVSGLMAQGRGIELHGGNPRELFSKGERDAADLALGPTKGGVRSDGLTPILPEMQRAPFKDMVSGATKSQIDAAAAFGPSLAEQLKADKTALKAKWESEGANLASPNNDFKIPQKALEGIPKDQRESMEKGAAKVENEALKGLKVAVYENLDRGVQAFMDRRNYTGVPATREDTRQDIESMPLRDQVAILSQDNLADFEKNNKVLAEYNTIFKNPYTLPASDIANELNLMGEVSRSAKVLKEAGENDPKREELDAAYRNAKVELAKLRGKAEVNYEGIKNEIAEYHKLEGQKDAQRKLIWDTNARAAIARVDEFKKIIDPESFEGGEEGSFDDPKSLYRTTYFKEVKDPVTEETYTDVVPDFYPWLNKFNMRVPSPPAAGLGTVINIGTGGRQESIVYMPEGVATDAKGQKPLEDEVEGPETVVFERERRKSNMTKAQRDIIDKARKSFKSSSKPKEIQGRTVKSSYDIKTDERIEDEEREWLLNQEEEVIFTNERGEEFVRIKDTIYRLK